MHKFEWVRKQSLTAKYNLQGWLNSMRHFKANYELTYEMTVTATKTICIKGDREMRNLELQRREICLCISQKFVYIAIGYLKSNLFLILVTWLYSLTLQFSLGIPIDLTSSSNSKGKITKQGFTLEGQVSLRWSSGMAVLESDRWPPKALRIDEETAGLPRPWRWCHVAQNCRDEVVLFTWKSVSVQNWQVSIIIIFPIHLPKVKVQISSIILQGPIPTDSFPFGWKKTRSGHF